jgi:alkylation response protein AidB-like acyl-CoA dehydrogenase
VTLDLRFDEGQEGSASTLAKFCKERCTAEVVKALTGSFPTALWSELADLGVFGVVTEAGGGGALEVVAAMEQLGRAVFPGPLAETFAASVLLDGETRDDVAGGRKIVSFGRPPLMPWVDEAQVFVMLDGDKLFYATLTKVYDRVTVLGGDRWGRVDLVRGAECAGSDRALALFDSASAAYLAGAGCALVDVTAEHARTRKQFGRSIGEFQAVAHPLADATIQLGAATILARAAACAFDEQSTDARAKAASARLSARRAALHAAYVCHQIFGAMGITLEGPVFHVSRRIRQLASAGEPVSRARELALGLFGA